MERIETTQDIYFEEVSRTIGGDVTPGRVRNVMNLLKEGGYIVQGVKSEKELESIREHGVLLLSPEAGFASVWYSGTGIFGNLTLSNNLQTLDSPFFNYSSAKTIEGDKRLLAVVMSNKELIRESLGVDIQPGDSYVTIGRPVPRDAFAILTTNNAHVENRKDQQILERQLFELFEDALLEGIKGGEEI